MLPLKKGVLLQETRKTNLGQSGCCFACGKETNLKTPVTHIPACSVHLQAGIANEETLFKKSS